MHQFRRTLVVALVLLGAAPVLQGQQPAPTAVTLSPKEMDVFLRTAKIQKKARVSGGVTDTLRATLSDGHVTHDAQIQTVDIAQPVFEAGGATEINFKDTYRYNIGAYRLARLLGMENVPMSVKRIVEGKDAAVTWWIDGIQFDEHGRLKLDAKDKEGPDAERMAKQTFDRLLFDELIQNRDRNAGNLLWDKDWKLWLIDHTRAFRLGGELMKPEQLTRGNRALLAAMRTLTFDQVKMAMDGVLTKQEITAVLVRRDLLIKWFDDRVTRLGEAAVLFTM